MILIAFIVGGAFAVSLTLPGPVLVTQVDGVCNVLLPRDPTILGDVWSYEIMRCNTYALAAQLLPFHVRTPYGTVIGMPTWWAAIPFVIAGVVVRRCSRVVKATLNCRKCGFSLAGLTRSVCPECGEPIDRAAGGVPNRSH